MLRLVSIEKNGDSMDPSEQTDDQSAKRNFGSKWNILVVRMFRKISLARSACTGTDPSGPQGSITLNEEFMPKTRGVRLGCASQNT